MDPEEALMWSATPRARSALLLAPVCLLALVIACGGNDQNGKPAGGSVADATTSGAVTIVARDNKYDKTTVKVAVNQEVAVTLTNKGSALHNWHLLGIKNPDGSDVKTDLIGSGETQTIRFTVDKPGTYEIKCDIHPEMTGKLMAQ
jgi:plastocyanin